MSRPAVTAVVLAGGASRRFGSDKLEVALDGQSLLDRALSGLLDDAVVIVVGPVRSLGRPVRFVSEEPPGGGPAAALVTGLQQALAAGAEEIVTLPGDAPDAGQAAVELLQVLRSSAGATAVVGIDVTGFEQPLQLALTSSAAAQLVAAAGANRGQGASARGLVRGLDPPARRHRLEMRQHWDVDTPQQLQIWRDRDAPAVISVLAAVDAVSRHDRPVVVALDGRSGCGKSTLAAALALRRTATVVSGDDFYSPELAEVDLPARERLTGAQVAAAVIDWRRLRDEALEPLARRQPARFARYDWAARDGRLGSEIELGVSDLVLLEGVYSGRPELADLVDLAVLVEVDEDVRRQRRETREHDAPDEVSLWERGEEHYFTRVRPAGAFDLRVQGSS